VSIKEVKTSAVSKRNICFTAVSKRNICFIITEEAMQIYTHLQGWKGDHPSRKMRRREREHWWREKERNKDI